KPHRTTSPRRSTRTGAASERPTPRQTRQLAAYPVAALAGPGRAVTVDGTRRGKAVGCLRADTLGTHRTPRPHPRCKDRPVRSLPTFGPGSVSGASVCQPSSIDAGVSESQRRAVFRLARRLKTHDPGKPPSDTVLRETWLGDGFLK